MLTRCKNIRYMHDMYRLFPRGATPSVVMRLHVVCLSVTLRYVFHTGWNTSKIIARPNSLGSLLSLAPTWAVWCNGDTPKIGVEYGGSEEGHKIRVFPCFLTYDVSSHRAAVNRCHARMEICFTVKSKIHDVGLHIMNSMTLNS